MTANLNDKIRKTGASTVTTLSAPGKALGASSITVGSTTNYPTDTGIIIAIRQVDTNSDLIPGTYTEWKAVVASATSFTINATPVYGSDQVYPAGSTTQVYIPLSSFEHNELVDALLEEHKQTGAHSDITADSATITNATITNLTIGSQTPSADWNTQSILPSSVVYNGQGSYTETYAQSVRSFKSAGQRNRYTRTVTAPTQSTSLNGTTQYWVKTSPNKLTFTDDFVVDAYVKMTSYAGAGAAIVSRRDGTQGWQLQVTSSGQVSLIAFNANLANYSGVTSYQSIPLNKWVRITAQLDMSTFTATTTTSFVMIDGVDVPSSVTRGGTNPTALVQAGNLEIGSVSGGAIPFPGKIAQVAIYNAKVTQANIILTHSQGLAGTETSLASAYSFNGVATDLNTTTPNGLTAMNGAGYTTSSPFTTQGDDVPNGTTDYSITQSVSSDGLTVVTQVPNGCAIPTSGGISAISYSGLKSPYGLPSDIYKWTIETYWGSQFATVVSSTSTWYNASNISIPAGSWDLSYAVNLFLTLTATASYGAGYITLSTANNTEINPRYSAFAQGPGVSSGQHDGTATLMSASIKPSSLTTYYINLKPATVNGTTNLLIAAYSNIYLKNAYL